MAVCCGFTEIELLHLPCGLIDSLRQHPVASCGILWHCVRKQLALAVPKFTRGQNAQGADAGNYPARRSSLHADASAGKAIWAALQS